MQNVLVAGEAWTQYEVEILAREYFEVLRSESRGQSVNKNEALRRARGAMPTDRTIHTLKDRCYRISEELWKRDLPFVAGWRPRQLVGQSPNNVAATIWAAIEPFASDLATQPDSAKPPSLTGSEQAYLADTFVPHSPPFDGKQ